MYKRLLSILFIFVILLASAHEARAADVDNFTVQRFEADYYLSREQGISRLEVKETIVAEFPQIDQNHGILRAIPQTYQNHPVDVEVEAITDAGGKSWAYTTYEENDNLVLKIGSANHYVHGEQTYHIRYHLQNVTLNLEDHDEFYWDINGTEWRQPFKSIVARLHISEELHPFLKPEKACYTGGQGSNDHSCGIQEHENGATFTFTASRTLQMGETLTLAVAFEKGTFVAYQIPMSTILWYVALIGGLGVLPPVLALWLAIYRWRKSGRDPRGRGTIVPEYLSPKEVSVLASSEVLKEKFVAAAISAQLIDLAVRHYLKVYEAVTEIAFIKKRSYELELLKDPAGLRPEEQAVLVMIFGKNPAVGARVKLDELSKTLYQKAQKIGEEVSAWATANGYFAKEPKKAKKPWIVWGVVLLIAGFIGMPWSLGLSLAGIILLIASVVMPARTVKGVALREYLLGLEAYMKLAEAERLRVLQSPSGSLTEKVPDTHDSIQLVKLYEKLLPYAMLFGIEKEWAEQFASLYQDQQPDWYSGSGAFHAAYFASSLHGFNETASHSFAAPSDSSSGGAGGGGFSGGGGGGGGGGGW